MMEAKPRMILGLDPGLAITGYGVIQSSGRQPTMVEAGVIRVVRDQTLPARLKELSDGIHEVISSFSLSAIAIEQLYSHYERPRTAILMGHARGVLCLAAAQSGLPVFSYEPTKVKKLLTGNGRAPKDQMQRAIQMQLNLSEPPDPPDVADALAIALCHHFTSLQTPEFLPKEHRTK
jgi:crossover junction endodeoxyribonuclease RuvC